MGRGALSPWHIVLIAVVVLVLFGAGKLPGFARSVGQSLRIFKAETRAMKDDDVALPAATSPSEIASLGQTLSALFTTSTGGAQPAEAVRAPEVSDQAGGVAKAGAVVKSGGVVN